MSVMSCHQWQNTWIIDVQNISWSLLVTADSTLMDNGTTCWIESRIDWLEGQWKHTASLKPYQDYLHTATKTSNMIRWRMALLNEWMIDFTFGEQDNQGSMIDSITLLLLDTPAILILLLLRYCSLDITATLLLQISLLDPFMLHLLLPSVLLPCTCLCFSGAHIFYYFCYNTVLFTPQDCYLHLACALYYMQWALLSLLHIPHDIFFKETDK